MLMTVDSRFFTAREEILFEETGTGTRLIKALRLFTAAVFSKSVL
jgi:hypothetical protein